MKPPIPNSYWVEKGRLLAGEHPHGGDTERTRERVQRLVEAGVRHFFDLTQPGELPSYRELLPEHVGYQSFPIPDHSLPESADLMRNLLLLLEESARDGAAVYLHCRAGIGRTGTAVGCYLRERGESGDSALDELNRLWQQNARATTWPTVPETDDQYEYIRRWRPGRVAFTSGRSMLLEAALPRFRGCLVGLAIGDVAAQRGERETPRRWTDDTAMTLCVAESLLACGGFDGRDQIERYRTWAQDPAAAGAAPDAALRPSVQDTLARALRSHSQLVGSHDPNLIDPAPLARCAAPAMFAAGISGRAAALGADVARVTHQTPLVVDTCRLFSVMLVAALAGERREAVLMAGTRRVGLPLREDVLAVAWAWSAPPGGRRSPPPGILGCLDRAVRSFARSADFAQGLARLQDAPGPDADATLAAYGALAGAHYGAEGLPAHWREQLAGVDRLEALAERLIQATLGAMTPG